MKTSAILSMVKRRRNASIFFDPREDRQWIQIGGNIYPLDGMPYLDKETLMIMMDVPEEKRDNYFITCENMPEKHIALTTDNAQGDTPAYKAWMSIMHIYDELRAVYIGEEKDDLVLVPEEAFRPIADSEKDYLLYAREVDGVKWIVAKDGFQLIAVIGRVVVNDDQAHKTLLDVARHIRTDIDRIKAEEAARDGEQQHI